MNTECLQRCVTICFTPHDYPDVAHSDANVHVVAPHSALSPMHFATLTAPIPYTWRESFIRPFHVNKRGGPGLAFHWDEIYISEPLALCGVSQNIQPWMARRVGGVIAAANCFLIVISRSLRRYRQDIIRLSDLCFSSLTADFQRWAARTYRSDNDSQ